MREFKGWVVLLSYLVIGGHGQNTTRVNLTNVYNETEEIMQEDPNQLLAHEQQRLIAYLFKTYDINVRPVSDPSKNLSVSITPSVRQILEVNERQQVLTLYFWLRMIDHVMKTKDFVLSGKAKSWYDKNLVWNKTDFKNLSQINVAPETVWLPDIALVNSAQDGQDALIYRKITTKVQVHNDGLCRWLSPYFSSTSCNIDSTDFPFDQQKCIVEMASWTQTGLKIDVNIGKVAVETSSYLQNIQWKLVSTTGYKEIKYYASSPDPFPSVMFEFVIRRRSLFYIINLILPCVILSLLSLMTFYIPPSSGERITLSISLLLTMLFTLYIVTENLPPDSTTVPLLTKFIGVAMLIMTLSLFATSVGIKFDGKAELMPRWMLIIINKYLACLVLYDTSWLHRLTLCEKNHKVLIPNSNEDQPDTLQYGYEDQDTQPENPTTCRHRRPQSLQLPNQSSESSAGKSTRSNQIINDIADKFHYISNHIQKKNAEEELEEEWKKAGEVLSKLFFWSFFAVLLFASIAVFSHAEYTE